MKQILQFELWPECNCQCDFCYLKDQNKKTLNSDKIFALKTALSILENKQYIKENYFNVSFIGGEFFQGQLNTQEIKKLFFQLMERTAFLLRNGIIEHTWISASLLIGSQKDLYDTLNIFSNQLSKLYITTSYDTIGRFKSKKMLDSWVYHMNKLHTEYSSLKLTTTIILTQDVINKYLNNKFTFNNFCNKYHTEIFLKHTDPYIVNWHTKDFFNSIKKEMQVSMPNFQVKRSDFIKFLLKFKQQEPEELYYKLFNIKYRSDNMVQFRNGQHNQFSIEKRYKKELKEHDTRLLLSCGHPIDYQCYADSDKCMLCDKQLIFGY